MQLPCGAIILDDFLTKSGKDIFIGGSVVIRYRVMRRIGLLIDGHECRSGFLAVVLI